MARTSPILPLHQQTDALLLPYGGSDDAPPIHVVGTYGELELEYAAIRKACILMDLPHRAVIEVTGTDRLDFLNRMVTQELKGMPQPAMRRSFWLNRKGRVDADLRVLNLPDRILLEVDIHAAPRTIAGLSAFVITEDVIIKDLTDTTHRLSLHGPTAPLLLSQLAGIAAIEPGGVATASIASAATVVYREDTTGEPGYELIVPTEHAAAIYKHLIESGHDTHHGAVALRQPTDTLNQRVRLRPAGWHAYNIARIEAGTPLYNIDFGPQSLPAESGVMPDRVSFTKGCYLGQEVVARMHARKQFKQTLVGLKFDVVKSPEDFALQPVEGSGVFPVVDGKIGPEAMGGITSSTISPMLGSAAVAFAQVKSGRQEAGTEVAVVVDGVEVRGRVQNGMTFWTAPRLQSPPESR